MNPMPCHRKSAPGMVRVDDTGKAYGKRRKRYGLLIELVRTDSVIRRDIDRMLMRK